MSRVTSHVVAPVIRGVARVNCLHVPQETLTAPQALGVRSAATEVTFVCGSHPYFAKPLPRNKWKKIEIAPNRMLRKWGLLFAAIAVEVCATLCLRASQDNPAWLVIVVLGYVTSFMLLMLVLRTGMPVGVAYGIWGALGTATTAVLAALIFGDPFTWPVVLGIALIISGVTLVEIGSHRAATDPPS